MKKVLIIAGLIVVLVAGVLVWLAGSVGPETAPTELKSRDIPVNGL